MGDLLFAIQENNALVDRLKIIINNENVANLSDGLHGEIFHQNGWIQRIRKYKSQNV